MYYGIHYLRGVAALLVLYSHVDFKMVRLHGWEHSNFGPIGVDIFFIISGFVICASYYAKHKTAPEFARDRFIRVIPVYWALTTLALLIFLVKPELVNTGGGTTSIFSSYTLIPTNTKLLVQNGWTLSYEIYFYILFAVSIFCAKGTKLRDPAVLTAILLCFGVVAGQVVGNQTWLLFNPVVLEFIMGMVLYKFRGKILLTTMQSVFLMLLSVPCYIVFSWYSDYLSRFIELGVPAFMLVAAVVGLECQVKRLKAFKVGSLLKVLGDSSYSLYLVHPFP